MHEISRRRFLRGAAAAGASLTLGPHAVLGSVSTSNRAILPNEGAITLCIFSKHLQFIRDFAELADFTASMGFRGVDLTVRPGGHIEPDRAGTDLPRAVAAIRSAGLAVPTITTHITDATQDHARTILETVAELGIPGYRMGWYRYSSATDVGKQLEAFRPFLQGLAELNADVGVRGDYQNHEGLYVGATVWDIARLVEEIPHELIGIQYDVRHATVEGGSTWPLGMDLLADRIGSFALKDAAWSLADRHLVVEDVPLGRGSVDFNRFWDIVRARQLRRPVSLHFEYAMPSDTPGLAISELKRLTKDIMQRDLTMLRKMLVQAGLG